MSSYLRLTKIILPGLLAAAFTTSHATTNLVPNPGFEDPQLNGWVLLAPHSQNSAQVVSDETHSGQAAVRLVANVPEETPDGKARSVQVYRDIVVPADSLIELSFWMKAASVVRCGDPPSTNCSDWYQLRAALYAYDASGGEPIARSEFLSTDGDICATESAGNCDWRHIRTIWKTPLAIARLRIAVMLTTSTGTVWVDDFEAKEIQPMPELDFSAQSNPVLIPPPWQMTTGNEKLLLNDLAVMNIYGQDRLQQEISAYFASLNITPSFDPADPGQYATVLYLGDESDSAMNARLTSRFPGNSWSDIGDEGYFISVTNDSQISIMIGANSERGRFYGVQSLKQLIKDGYLYVADILDRPENARRGAVVGVQWFNKNGEAVRRIAERKGNFAWNQGSYMSGKYFWNWREPFTSGELDSMEAYLGRATSRFVDVYLSFGPRIRRHNVDGVLVCDEDNYRAPQFSDSADADVVVNKMLALYERGFRNFGINFDDVTLCNEDRLRYPQDITQFGDDIGVAHTYFVNQVYTRLKAAHDDIKFMMIPLWYGASSRQSIQRDDYLVALRGLDPAIELHTVQVFDEDMETLTSRAQRPTMNWSNTFAASKNAIYIMPYISMMTWDPDQLSGFIFLPAMPDTATQINEDQAFVSWNTALSYAWAPDRYDAIDVFQRSGALYEGAQDPMPVVSAPVISPGGSSFTQDTQVALATTTTGTDIYYTLDGSVPVNDGGSGASQLYTGPVTLSHTTALSARAFRSGFAESPVVSAVFTLRTLTSGETTGFGSTTGSHFDTHASDDTYEILQEEAVGASGRTRAEHTWTFDTGAGGNLWFGVEAHHAPSVEGENFEFLYSTDNISFIPMLIVSKTVDDGTVQEFQLPAGITGPLHVRVRDTDRTQKTGEIDILYVDQLYVESR